MQVRIIWRCFACFHGILCQVNDAINALQTASQKRRMPLQNGRMTMNHFIIGIWFGDNLDDHF
ncbi:hypothetical protein EGS24_06910 [Salmonella enterica]|uniref:Uncharacterized protein n=2 Tax=Salmonella enterica TaxID=28901 RepID=A0A3V7P0L3_SALET|nr:hypothetical protein [Salmonella enterica]EAA5147753.1 hypothetical protein [Salmonella enterica subsp. enterica serovar Agona]EAY3108612.1 hypothetical protein [Salmonella enterica subsp. enterica serovar Typhimurium]ECX3548060.1 hypothetical protein [Salmonella enterica subsp. enterica serovar Derby]KYC00228.1 hypothetical protein AGQ63_09280 [Salmonella enterica subsp. enterica]